MALAFCAASMSIGTGLPGDGLEWAECAGGGAAVMAGCGRGKTDKWEGAEGCVCQWEAWKASSAARFWSI